MDNVVGVSYVDLDNNRIPSHHLSNLRISRLLEGLGLGASNLFLSVNHDFDRNLYDQRIFFMARALNTRRSWIARCEQCLFEPGRNYMGESYK